MRSGAKEEGWQEMVGDGGVDHHAEEVGLNFGGEAWDVWTDSCFVRAREAGIAKVSSGAQPLVSLACSSSIASDLPSVFPSVKWDFLRALSVPQPGFCLLRCYQDRM